MAQKQNHKKATKESPAPANISKEVGNYEKHPFFVKKLNEAKEFLAEVGLPKELVKKS